MCIRDSNQRAKVLTMNAAALQISFAVAGFSGPWLYANYHINGLAFCSLLILLAVSYTHLRAHETVLAIVCRLLLEKTKKTKQKTTHMTRSQ